MLDAEDVTLKVKLGAGDRRAGSSLPAASVGEWAAMSGAFHEVL